MPGLRWFCIVLPTVSLVLPAAQRVRMSLPKELLVYCFIFGFSFPLMVLLLVI